MSKLGIGEVADNPTVCNQHWTHEICRIWGKQKLFKETKEVRSDFDHSSIRRTTKAGTVWPSEKIFECYTCDVCALCGMGECRNIETEEDMIDIDKSPQPFCQYKGLSLANSPNLVPGLVRCAAKGCFVTFHPMCAVLSSKLRQDNNYVENGKTHRKEKDKYLSKSYTLTLISVRRQNESSNVNSESVVPVAFCGLHNPLREEEFYGRILH